MKSKLVVNLENLVADLNKLIDSKKAKLLSSFFKTGKGEYGEGDIFLGITIPMQRKIAKKYSDLKLRDVEKLLKSKIHEQRMVALMILINKYSREGSNRKELVDFYLNNIKYINNWDLVDGSAYFILGDYLFDKEKDILYNLITSDNLWARRIAIISTFKFIRKNQFSDTLKICEYLLHDKQDLIHKACGWMLREVGKKNKKILNKFLNRFSLKMPRTMLRYSIEKFTEKERQKYLMQ